jgi:hypothetical protein
VRPCLEKPFTKIGLVEWFKGKALSSNPNTTNKQTNKNFLYVGFVSCNVTESVQQF